MNVLFIAIDDLRPEVGVYGAAGIHTPNLDQLAADGLVFLRHYVQVPTCGASRYSMFTGQRPTSAAELSNEAFVNLLPKQEGERPESFAHLFRRNGYHTAAIGKISHYPDGRVYTYSGEGEGSLEMPFSWDEVQGPIGRWGTAWNAFFGYADGSSRQSSSTRPAYEMAEVPDTGYPDGLIAEAAVRKLGELKDRPFLLAVGFFKPHLPFTSPKKYWDLYDRDSIALSPNPLAPEGINPGSLHGSGEFFNNYGSHPSRGGAGVRIDDDYARTLRHAYYAAVSYTDAQVGKVLDELDRLGLRENTIVIVWGDHGWHLGDHTIWGKHTTFERSLRSPLIVRVPGMTRPGRATSGIVESVDIYPTLAELCRLEPPAGLSGESFAGHFTDPAHPGKNGAYGYFTGRRTLRTDRFRITEYAEREPTVELYDHATDPLETINVASRFPEVVERLLPRLRAPPTR
jgi:arylsulfatase A-like enzyme